MNLILIPSSGKGQHASFGPGQLAVMGIVLLLVPILLGVVTYQVQALLGVGAFRDTSLLLREQRQIQVERVAIQRARNEAAAHLDALAQRVGHLQAQMMRLNALGSRLTRMAGLDKREFNFSEEPPMGGPEAQANSQASVPDFLKSLDQLSQDIGQKSARLSALESFLLDRKLAAAVTPRGWPVDGGYISSGFGPRADPFTGRASFHPGIDIADHAGASIRAMAAGVVSYAGPREGYGLMVEINHGNGQYTRYGHAEQVLVKVGDTVHKGDAIALVGSTGRSTGPHVHFEVWRDGRVVNPQRFLHLHA